MTNDIFNRVRLLTGNDGFESLAKKRVIVFGVGGVGSWCAESLVRTGISHITLVDADIVAESNINRQLMATSSTVGQPKAEVLARRLSDINPRAEITVIVDRYTAANSAEFNLASYDYIVDAIDSLADKASLILESTALPRPTRLFSSMGAALRIDPTRITVAEFWKVKGDPLAAALRRRFKRNGTMPRRKFMCVYSEELLKNRTEINDTSGAMTFNKVAVNGAVCHITAIFGLTLAGLIVKDAIST